MGRLNGRSPSSPVPHDGRDAVKPIRLAEEGADTLAVDIARQIDTDTYALATP